LTQSVVIDSILKSTFRPEEAAYVDFKSSEFRH
jgi:hypothetical protein